MEYYIVSSFDPECYNPTILKGQKVENWEEYCNSLMPEAIKLAIKKYSKGNKDFDGAINHLSLRITEERMSEAMIEVLKKKGYELVKFQEKSFGWRGDFFDINEIELHNLRAELENNESYIERKNDYELKKDTIDYLQEKNAKIKTKIKELEEN